MTIQVLIVDDSAVVRSALSQLVGGERDMAVMATAADPFKAAEAIKKAIPDVVLLDIEMPRMDGLTFLRRIMAQKPMPVIVCSTLIEDRSPAFLEAFKAGAVDVIGKPKLATPAMFEETRIVLTDKIRAAAHAKLKSPRSKPRPQTPVVQQEKLTADVILPSAPYRGAGPRPPIVALGASTGGTEALPAVLKQLGADTPAIVVVQHMPERFTAAFARRLNEFCPMAVKEAANGDIPRRGLVLIAPGDRHLVVRGRADGYRVETVDGPLVSRHRPSVDVLFRSVAQAAGPNALGALMTGMGDDGARCLGELQAAGATTLAQDERSCVVFGMPAEAIKRGHADHVTDLNGIAAAISRHRDGSPRAKVTRDRRTADA